METANSNDGNRRAILELETTLFQPVMEETFREAGKELEDWSEHTNNVIDAIRSLKMLQRPEETDSMVVFRMVALFREVNWVHHAIVRGAYHSAIRDLRYLVESMVQAYWLWKKYPHAEMDQKHELLPAKMQTKKLFEESGVEGQAELYELFKRLSKFAHPTKEELEPVMVRGRVGSRFVFAFDRELFDQTRRLAGEAMDAMLYVFFLRFPEARKPFLESPHVAEGLETMEQIRTLNILRAATTVSPSSNQGG